MGMTGVEYEATLLRMESVMDRAHRQPMPMQELFAGLVECFPAAFRKRLEGAAMMVVSTSCPDVRFALLWAQCVGILDGYSTGRFGVNRMRATRAQRERLFGKKW